MKPQYQFNTWKIQYTVGFDRHEVILMRKSYAASVIRSLRKKGIVDIVVLGPKDDIEGIYGAEDATGTEA